MAASVLPRCVTSAEAFEMLRKASTDLNRTLRDLAAEVELTGRLPSTPGEEPQSRLDGG